MDKETLAVLRRLGLNQYESRTYLALVTGGAKTATELSDVANIPRPRVYDVLAKLEKRGFVIAQPGRPTRYAAVPIKTAIASLKKERAEAHKKEIEELEKLEQRLMSYLSTIPEQEAIKGEVYVLKDRRNIYAAIGELISNAKKHVILASHREGLQRKRNEYGSLLHKATKNGVKVKLVENPNMRLVIVDDHAFLFLVDAKDDKGDMAAWIKSRYVADALRSVLQP
ncbi:MAG: TrmB family transcriptional regulator [Candidatus Diapherotrites archaeon]|nr:TrmB family transcriptional regulator [Candidatus Diapherotrites archaeon]